MSRLNGIALNLKTLTTKVLGITLDTNGQRRIIPGLAVVGPSRLSKVARNISSRNPNTRIVKPGAESNLSVSRIRTPRLMVLVLSLASARVTRNRSIFTQER